MKCYALKHGRVPQGERHLEYPMFALVLKVAFVQVQVQVTFESGPEYSSKGPQLMSPRFAAHLLLALKSFERAEAWVSSHLHVLVFQTQPWLAVAMELV